MNINGEKKVAVIAIIVSDETAAPKVNEILHEAREFIVGRLGIPYKVRAVSVISVVLDAPQEFINALSGKLGMVRGVSSKVLTTK